MRNVRREQHLLIVRFGPQRRCSLIRIYSNRLYRLAGLIPTEEIQRSLPQ
jgi:hypothetical protein